MARRSDYDSTDVIPVSNPNASTTAQKIVQYQSVLQLAQSAPQLYNLPLLHRQMIEVLGVKNADKLVPIEDDAAPTDPVQENQNALTAKPVKAFIEQNHEAHIAVHTAFIQDPKIQQVVGQSPMGQQMMAAMMAHINEHMAFQYRREIEAQLGLPMPSEEENKRMPEDIAAQIAELASQAAQRVLQNDQAAAAQQQAVQQQQDPVLQMQMQEIQIKMKKLELDEKKLSVDAAAKTDQLDIERERIASQERIAGMQVGARVEGNKRDLAAKQQAEGVRLGIDIAKSKVQAAQQNRAKTQQGTK